MHDMQLRQASLSSLSREQRVDLYSAIVISEGEGTIQIDSGAYEYSAPAIVFVTPFQTLQVLKTTSQKAHILQFHGDFYCIEFHKPEVACNGLLFNNVYLSPVLPLTKGQHQQLQAMLGTVASELKMSPPDQSVLVSYLQLFLALTSRIKRESLADMDLSGRDELMEKLKTLIDEYFLTKHSPSEYAKLLAINANAMTKRSRKYFGKTPSQLIQERLILEARKQLHLTRLSVKEIAFLLNFEDEHYFSRFFKKAVGLSPQLFRKKAGISIVADLSRT